MPLVSMFGAEPTSYLTGDVPPVGGRLRERPEDFLVEELPLYQPGGSGEHLYLFLEKRNLTTMEMVAAVARHFGVRRDAVGYAGLKDKRAVTRQLVSVHLPGKKDSDFPPFQHERITVLWVDRHANKLRLGHLAGNRFIIRIRGAEPARAVHAWRALRVLEKSGVPNRAGEQRFGYLARNHLIGRALLLGEYREVLDLLLGPSEFAPAWQHEARALYVDRNYDQARALYPHSASTERRALAALAKGSGPKRAVLDMDPMQRRFFITAFQSAVFNTILDARLHAGTLGALEPGDVAFKHDNRACFLVEPAALPAPAAALDDLAARLARLEISPSGPMWGANMLRAQGDTLQRELAALEATGVTPDTFTQYAQATRDRVAVEGARRPLRVPLRFPDIEGGIDEAGPYIRCAFELPRGAFATVVMREIIKPELAAPAGADHAAAAAEAYADPEDQEHDPE